MTPPSGRTLGRARGPLRGILSLPGDKSIAHRALILGALAEGGLRVRNLPRGLDVRSTMRCLKGLGASLREDEGDVLVEGPSPGRLSAPAGALDCGNSGTTMRLLLGVLAGHEFSATLTGDESLSRRPMGRVAEPLRLMGARVDLSAGAGGGPPDVAPVSVTGRRPLRALQHVLAVPSAQVKSAVLLAALAGDGPSRLEDPFGTRDHTERMLGWLMPGHVDTDGLSTTLRPGVPRGGRALTLPGDVSTAAFFAAAAVLVPGSEVVFERVGLNPGRTGLLDELRHMGAPLVTEGHAVASGEDVGRLIARPGALRSCRVPVSRVASLIDEVPLLAVLASQAEGVSVLAGLGELRRKESDRLAATAEGLAAMGARVEVREDDLIVEGPCRLKGARIETRGDHRLAMAFAIAALVAEGETTLTDADCAAVSFPEFFETLEGLAA